MNITKLRVCQKKNRLTLVLRCKPQFQKPTSFNLNFCSYNTEAIHPANDKASRRVKWTSAFLSQNVIYVQLTFFAKSVLTQCKVMLSWTSFTLVRRKQIRSKVVVHYEVSQRESENLGAIENGVQAMHMWKSFC
jgi:hypothetical protein